MIITVHFLFGAILITTIPNIFLAVFLIIITHYLLDIIPHWEYSIENIKKKNWKKSLPDFLKLAIDFLISVLIVFLFSKNPALALTGGFLSIIPDGLIFLQLVMPNKILKAHLNFHNKFHLFRR